MTQTRKAILHIGTMKTGTTSVQASLQENAGWLADRGHSYLGWPLRTSALLKQRIAAIPEDHDIIVSDEGLWHFAFSKRSDTEAIAECLAGFEVTILVYLRRPDEFLEAWFSQGLKTGTGGTSISSFLASSFVKSGNALDERLAAFANLFGKAAIKVVPFERSQMAQGDIVLDFLEKTGLCPAGITFDALNEQGFTQITDRNISPDPDALMMLSILRHFASLEESLLAKISNRMVEAAKSKPKTTRTRLFTREEALAINATMRPELQKIQAEYGGGVAPDFFVNWPTEETPHEVSPIRSIFDAIITLPKT